MNSREVYAAANKFLLDRGPMVEAADLSDAAVERMRQVAAISLQLEPLPPGDNDGRVYFSRRPEDAEPVLALDTNGHEAFAEFISNARPWILALSSEILRIREELRPVLENKHLTPCPIVGGEDEACACHYWIVRETMQPDE
jgi:hypothetical protein